MAKYPSIIDNAPREGEVKAKSGDSQNIESERKTVQMVEKMFKRAKRARQRFDRDWAENYKFVRGKQWTEGRPSYLHSEVLNITSTYIDFMVAILSDFRPVIETIPENPTDYEFSSIMSQIMTGKWERESWTKTYVEAMYDGLIYGTAISDQSYDHEALFGLGDMNFKRVDPFYFYPDPDATDVNTPDSKYVITAIPTNINEVKRKYPKKAEFIKADVSDLDVAKSARRDMEDFIVRSPTDNLMLVQGERAPEITGPDEVLVITCYMKDDAVIEEEIEEKDEQGNIKKGFRTRKKYPNGRCIIIAANQVLKDNENEYKDGKFPFAKFCNRIMPGEFWGASDLEKLKGPQQIINKLMSYGLDTISLVGNPVWLNPLSSNVDNDSLINKQGLVIPHTDEFPPIRLPGMEIPSSVFALLDRSLEIFKQVSGIYEVSMGAQPSSNTSGIAVQSLQEASQTLLRLKARNGEIWLTQAGQQIASRILQYYSVPRIVRITDNPDAEKYFKVYVEDTTDESGEGQRVATITQMQKVQTPEGEQMIEGAPIQYEIKGNLDIRITTGTTLPFAKQQKETRAMTLFQAGIYDAEDLLTALDDPKKEKILNKIKEREAAQQQALMAQQQAQASMSTGMPQPQPPMAA